MEFITKRKLAVAGLVLLGGASLSGCGEELDYEGAGNTFQVRGIVHDVEDDGRIHVNEKQLVVLESEGKAEDWFPDHEGQDFLSEEFNFDQKFSKEPGGWFDCGDDEYVGEVFDSTGEQMDPEDLEPGMVVVIDGRIRESIYYQSTGKSGYCNGQDRAVYDSVMVVEEPLNIG